MNASRFLVLSLATSAALGMAALHSGSVAQTNQQDSTALALHPGWMLASACFACHGTDGKDETFGSINGMDAADLIDQMDELKKTTDADAAIMRVHALGYSDEQIKLIADYFSKVQ